MQSSLWRIWCALFLALCVTTATVGCKDSDKDKKEEKKDKKDKDDKKKDKNKENWVDLFNKKDLTNWEGDPNLWKVVDGTIVGESTPEHPANYNTFLIYRGGGVKDFKLRLKVKITGGGNSGVQYRSKEVEDAQNKWRVQGYQAEVSNKRDPADIGGGFLYHEGGRGELAFLGTVVAYDAAGTKHLLGKLGDPKAMEAANYFKNDDWNEYTIIARGSHMVHYVNGFLVAELYDNDATHALREGVLALQLHAGGPMKVEYKDIRMHTYTDDERQFNDSGNNDWVVPPTADQR